MGEFFLGGKRLGGGFRRKFGSISSGATLRAREDPLHVREGAWERRSRMSMRKKVAARESAFMLSRCWNRNTRIFRTSPATLAALLLACMLLAGLFLPACDGGRKDGGGIKVAVDIVPLAQICRSVGGEWVEVEVLVPPGASPHAYELTTEQMRFLSDADLLVVVGLGLIPWEKEILSKVDREGLAFIEAGEEIPAGELIAAGETHHGGEAEEQVGEEEHGSCDPHVWLDPVLAKDIVVAVRDGLMKIDQQHASFYEANAESLLEDMEALHQEITRRTAAFSRREFIAFHSSWTYFARRYGLGQVGVIEERPGKEPSAGEIAELVMLAREKKVGAIFAEAQFSARVAEAVAEESGGEVRVWMLDPLGDLGDPEKDDYCDQMRYNLSVMEEALR